MHHHHHHHQRQQQQPPHAHHLLPAHLQHSGANAAAYMSSPNAAAMAAAVAAAAVTSSPFSIESLLAPSTDSHHRQRTDSASPSSPRLALGLPSNELYGKLWLQSVFWTYTLVFNSALGLCVGNPNCLTNEQTKGTTAHFGTLRPFKFDIF